MAGRDAPFGTADLLRWAMPRLGLDPRGFRNVRGTVIRRVQRRIAELRLEGAGAYRARLGEDAGEWSRLEAMCRILISRWWRDAHVYRLLEEELLPERLEVARAEGRDVVRVWSAGCASGEEPCSVAVAWAANAARRPGAPRLEIVATDADRSALERASAAVYTESSANELPRGHLSLAFTPGGHRARPEIAAAVTFLEQDLRRDAPSGSFDVVLCRNVAFTYFDEASRRDVAACLVSSLAPGGFLLVGRGETLPATTIAMRVRAPLVYERTR